MFFALLVLGLAFVMLTAAAGFGLAMLIDRYCP